MEPENENDVHPTEDSARDEQDTSNLAGSADDESDIQAEPGAQSADETDGEGAEPGMGETGAEYRTPVEEPASSADAGAESQSARLRIEIDLVEGDLTI